MKKRLSKAERARINRNNARKSTGPRTEAGKKSASINSYKHGLCAKTIALPTEDAALLQEKLALVESTTTSPPPPASAS